MKNNKQTQIAKMEKIKQKLSKMKPYQHDLLLWELKWFNYLEFDSIDSIIEKLDSRDIVWDGYQTNITLCDLIYTFLFDERYCPIFDKTKKNVQNGLFISEDLVDRYKKSVTFYWYRNGGYKPFEPQLLIETTGPWSKPNKPNNAEKYKYQMYLEAHSDLPNPNIITVYYPKNYK